MPTNEERREIAARMRVLASNAPEDAEIVNGVFIKRLADLIEPETERTCKMTKKGPEYVLGGWWECSECGPVYPPCNDEIAIWALQYCPRCRAKVVE